MKQKIYYKLFCLLIIALLILGSYILIQQLKNNRIAVLVERLALMRNHVFGVELAAEELLAEHPNYSQQGLLKLRTRLQYINNECSELKEIQYNCIDIESQRKIWDNISYLDYIFTTETMEIQKEYLSKMHSSAERYRKWYEEVEEGKHIVDINTFQNRFSQFASNLGISSL